MGALTRRLRHVLRITPLYDAYIVARAQALREWGWFRSLRQRRPVDRMGHPLPWYTYPCIHLLEGRIRPGLMVFEFGSGNSTLWWARRAGAVRAVEHDRKWFERLRASTPANVTLVWRAMRDPAYVSEVQAENCPYDVIVIDGRLRNRCAEVCVDSLSHQGVIIWDNSNRPQYRRGLRLLADRGFKRLEMVGLTPGLDVSSATSILYRGDNCLGL